MIISLKHNYIYVRTRKTGSSTIEWWLRQHLGPEDIVVKSSLDCLRPVTRPDVVIPEAAGLITHVSAAQVMPLVREDLWTSAYRFTSERHPYEKALSFAHYRLERLKKAGHEDKLEEKSQDFDKHLNRVVRSGKYASYPYYSLDGKPLVEDFIKLESFQQDLERVSERIGVPLPQELPRKRGNARADRRPAREVLTAEQQTTVYEHCKPEFDLLGYER